jgi:hypothetical protein
MRNAPRIKSVTAVGDAELLVSFANGVEKVYDCKPVFARPEYHLLKAPALFRAARVDPGGYGISWNDKLDLSEYELWTDGESLTSHADI